MIFNKMFSIFVIKSLLSKTFVVNKSQIINIFSKYDSNSNSKLNNSKEYQGDA